MILLSAILAAIISAIEGSKLWSKTSKGRLKTLFLLSIIATIASSTGFYFKSESERFFQEEKDKYAILSIEMDEVIREFYFSFRRENFTDETIKIDSIRKEFINVGDRVGINQVKQLEAFPLNILEQVWGVAILKLQANLPGTVPGQIVTQKTITIASTQCGAVWF